MGLILIVVIATIVIAFSKELGDKLNDISKWNDNKE